MSVKFRKRRTSHIKTELQRFQLLNEMQIFDDSLQTQKENQKIRKIQRKFAKSQGWKAYVS